MTDPATTRAISRLRRFFEEQKRRIAREMRSTLPASKSERMKAAPTWWDPQVEDAELTAAMREIYADVGTGALQNVSDRLGRVIQKGATQSVVSDLLTVGGQRIKEINDRTLQALTVEIAEGTRRGYSIPQLIDGVPDEGYRGVLQAGMDNGVAVWSDNRAETIARTETMLSYNRATLTGYGEFGITEFLAYDGDDDPECAERDGQTFPIDEAEAIEDHPNGTLVWSPIVGDQIDQQAAEEQAAPEEAAQPTMTAIEADDRLQAVGYYGSDLTGLDEAAIHRVVVEAERLATEYPKLLENMKTTIELSRAPAKGAYAATSTSTYNGVQGTYGLTKGEARIYLNKERWLNQTQLASDLQRDFAAGWIGGPDLEYALDHEFGHILDAALKNPTARLRPSGVGLTDYGKTDAQEFFAEVFAQILNGADYSGTDSIAADIQRILRTISR